MSGPDSPNLGNLAVVIFRVGIVIMTLDQLKTVYYPFLFSSYSAPSGVQVGLTRNFSIASEWIK